MGIVGNTRLLAEGRAVRFIAVSLCLIVAFSISANAAKQARIALVIGNSAYESNPLANPVNDARLISQTLKELGFDVIEHLDVTRKKMRRAIVAFEKKLRDGGTSAVGLFYYAGHGLQVKGKNFLVPIDADIQRDYEVDDEAVDANNILEAMEFAGNKLNFVILDACRNNPYSRSFRSASRGLARMSAPSGTLVAYSTAPGDVAADGTGANSPYSEALARAMRIPGAPVEQVFKQVRIAVRTNTKEAQTPWESSSLTGNFSFLPSGTSTPKLAALPAAKPLPAARPAAPRPAPTPAPAPAVDPAVELEFWRSIKDSNDAGAYKDYLKEYPKGKFVRIAKRRIKNIKVASARPVPRTVAPPKAKPAPVQRQVRLPIAPRPKGAKIFFLTPVKYDNKFVPWATEKIYQALRVVPSSHVVRNGAVAPTDTLVNASIMKLDYVNIKNPNYASSMAGAVLMQGLFGNIGQAMASRVREHEVIVDVEVMVVAKDQTTGKTTTETGRGYLKVSDYQSRNAATRQAVDAAFADGAKRMATRLLGNEPKAWVQPKVFKEDKDEDFPSEEEDDGSS
jgi:hypothetical protein